MTEPENPESPWQWKPTALDPASEDFEGAARFTAQLDQENVSGPSMNTLEVPEEAPVDFLIDRVIRVVPETAQMGTEPLTTIAGVLAQLYQAQALHGIAGLLVGIDEKLGALVPGTVKPGETGKVDWQQEAQGHRLSAVLDKVARGIRDALDPELSRPEVIGILKALDTERFIRHR